jgi:hypothetical protein
LLDRFANRGGQINGIHVEPRKPASQEVRLLAIGEAPLDDEPALAVHDAQSTPPRQFLGGQLGITDRNAQEVGGALQEREQARVFRHLGIALTFAAASARPLPIPLTFAPRAKVGEAWHALPEWRQGHGVGPLG